MRSSIFIKTYPADLKWLRWSMAFLEKNWEEDSELVIVCPNSCSQFISEICKKFSPVIFPREEWPDGYIGQQYFKLTACHYCKGDYITFFDSDAMLVKPTDLQDLCDGERPIVLYTPYSILGNTVPWQKIVTSIMMLEPADEYMRCLPFTYKASTLANCCAHLERLHGQRLDVVMSNWPLRQFTEFNVIGFYAYVFEKDNYSFHRLGDSSEWSKEDIIHTTRIKQFHSYTEWNEAAPQYFAKLLDDQ